MKKLQKSKQIREITMSAVPCLNLIEYVNWMLQEKHYAAHTLKKEMKNWIKYY